MSGIKFKISRTGYDAETASDANLAFSSDFFTPRIYKIKRYTSSTTEAHGLSYAPMFLAYANNPWSAGVDVFCAGGASVGVTDTDVRVTVSSPSTVVWVVLFVDKIDG